MSMQIPRLMLTLEVPKQVRPNGPVRQPVLEGTGWVEDFNPSARYGRCRLARQLDGPKYGSARPGPLARFKKIKLNKSN